MLATKLQSFRKSDHKFRKVATSLWYYLRRHKRWESVFTLDRQGRFTEIYKHNLWNNEESISGGGSTVRATEALRAELPSLLTKHGIRSIVDVGCGDFHWLKRLNLDVDYLGLDIVSELIERNTRLYGNARRRFRVADAATDPIPRADLVICRDCLFHCSHADLVLMLANIGRSGSRYLLATHTPAVSVNVDIETGSCRLINFELAPYHFPSPLTSIMETHRNRSLALWRVDQIPSLVSSDV
jgi:SAM-dependent methyltransferase